MEQKKMYFEKTEPGFMGVTVLADGIHIQTVLHGTLACGILLYPVAGETFEETKPVRLDFPESCREGAVYSCILKNCDSSKYFYMFHEDGNPVADRYARKAQGHFLFGAEHRKAGKKDAILGFSFVRNGYNWKEDKNPATPYENSIYYGMHVRGFTKDPSSGVKEAGTYLGIQRKIPYLKKLGTTGIVLQPTYEFEECRKELCAKSVAELLNVGTSHCRQDAHINYWGYLKGFYFAPKNSYSWSGDSVKELKDLIYHLHQNRMEIILQFYFPPEITGDFIREVLEYWSIAYHVDGFHLLGATVHMEQFASDPFLVGKKIWSEYIPVENIYGDHIPAQRSLAVFQRDFMDAARCFLKGDENSLSRFTERMRYNPSQIGQINYLASYGGFRLMDVVSYERKHNEANGEDNHDGENYNCSWNCGEEGESSKRNILALRSRLIRNALCFLMLSQGTPFLFMGDECGKTGYGNNNPYCQDNETTWLQWKHSRRQQSILHYTQELIRLRLSHPILHRAKQSRIMDTLSCGFPDLSYHGREAWKPDFSYYVRHIGIMLCGLYEKKDRRADHSFYFVINSHWEEHEFALPKLPEGMTWQKILDSENTKIVLQEDVVCQEAGTSVVLKPRCVCLYESFGNSPETGKKTMLKR